MHNKSNTSSPSSDFESRPEYGRLKANLSATYNLILAENRGIRAVLRMLSSGPKAFRSKSKLLYLKSEDTDCTSLDEVRNIEGVDAEVLTSYEDFSKRAEELFLTANMGTTVYVAGGESFLGLVVNHALQHRIHHNSIVTELQGSLARRVQCVHCKHTAENITTSIYDCPQCGETLMVRDHYSRRLAAYQGVSATVESPGETPQPEELYR